jgi:enamine deaminase RidA (YjgF/YER057c/UK114 family)
MDRGAVTLELVNPDDLPTPEAYSHVVIATGARLVFVSGQEPEDERGNLVGAEDLAAQAQQVFANLGRALTAAGARPDDVTRISIFVVDYRRDQLPLIDEARATLFGDHRPADTLVGVAALSRPEFLIEVEAIAVTD